MVQFSCECGQQIQARDEDAGKQVKCPSCGALSFVPRSQGIVPEESAARSGRGGGAARESDRDEDDRPRRGRREGPKETSGKATAALILGILSFPCFIGGILTGLPAIILGALALSDIGKSGGRLGGKGMAITGLVAGCLGFLMIPVMIGLLLPAVQKVRSAAVRAQEQNNLKQMGVAMNNFAGTYNGAFPQAAAFRSPTGKPLLSWRVAILPYIEQQNLYMQFKLDEPWDSPNNIKLLPMIPKTYQQPGDPPDGNGLTLYQVLVGAGTMFDESAEKQGRAGELRLGSNLNHTFNVKGTSNTIMIATAEQGVPWTKPEDLTYDPKGPLPVFSKRYSRGWNVGLADGSVKVISPQMSEKTLRWAIVINDVTPPPNDW